MQCNDILKMSAVAAEIRKVHSAYLDNKIVCSICYSKSKDPKFFLKDEGIKQHFRTIHRERFSDKILSDCEELMKDLHGEETRQYLISLGNKLQKEVRLVYLTVIYTRSRPIVLLILYGVVWYLNLEWWV